MILRTRTPEMRTRPERIRACVLALAASLAAGGGIAQTPTGVLVGRVVDEASGKGIPARVYAIGSDDSVHLAADELPFARYSERHFTTLDDRFIVTLPAGDATLRLERGKEYVPVEARLRIAAGDTVERTFRLRRWIDMASRGWYSGEHHLHRVKEAVDLAGAEDLNVGIALSNWNMREQFLTEARPFLDRADAEGVVRIDETHLVSFLGAEIETSPAPDFGRGLALFYHLLDRSAFPLEIRGHGNRLAEYVELARRTKALGGYVELEKPGWTEGPVIAALVDLDFVGVAHNHMLFAGYIPEGTAADPHSRLERTVLASDYPAGEIGYTLFTLDLYYRYLNAGFRMMPAAGSASYPLANVFGYNRMYARVDGPLTIRSWFDAVKAGRTFVTNGPFVMIDSAGLRPDGTVSVAVRAFSPAAIDRLELIHDGEVVRTFQPVRLRGDSVAVTASFPVTESGWIAARIFERRTGDDVRFGHTAPIFIDVPGRPFRPRRDAVDWLLARTDDLIRDVEKSTSVDPADRRERLDLYGRARAFYLNLLRNARERPDA